MRFSAILPLAILITLGCGKPEEKPTEVPAQRMYGVRNGSANDWRLVGAIQLVKSHKLCSGTLISPSHILTAKHCLPVGTQIYSGVDFRTYKPFEEIHFSNRPNIYKPGNPFVKIARVYYPDLNFVPQGPQAEDIAIAKLESPYPEIGWGVPIFKNVSFTIPKGFYGWIQGYGRTGEEGIDVGTRTGGTVIFDKGVLGRVANQLEPQAMLRVYPERADQIGCPGDSGGPLQMKIGGVIYIMGVLSTGHYTDGRDKCNTTEYNNYTATAPRARFIESVLRD